MDEMIQINNNLHSFEDSCEFETYFHKIKSTLFYFCKFQSQVAVIRCMALHPGIPQVK